jgi:excisionase family DNA binding protein
MRYDLTAAIDYTSTGRYGQVQIFSYKGVVMLERLYSVPEAAEALRISQWTVWAMLKDGRLRGTKVGDRRLIRESELARLMVDDPRSAKTGTGNAT